MTNEHLSTIELETGFLRRDGNPVAADEIERAARELSRPTTMTDVDTRELPDKSLMVIIESIIDNPSAVDDAVKMAMLTSAFNDLRALAAERDELERLAGDMEKALRSPMGDVQRTKEGLAFLAYQRKNKGEGNG